MFSALDPWGTSRGSCSSRCTCLWTRPGPCACAGPSSAQVSCRTSAPLSEDSEPLHHQEGRWTCISKSKLELLAFLCASSNLIEDSVARGSSEPSVGFVKYLKKRMESVTDWLQLYIWRWPISVSSLILPLVLLLVLEEETLEVDHQQRGRRWPGRRWWRESGTASCWEESGELMQGWDVVSHEIFTDDVAIIID